MRKKNNSKADTPFTTGKGNLIIKTGDVTTGGKSGDINITTFSHGSIDSSHISDKVQDSTFHDFKSETNAINKPPTPNPIKKKDKWTIWLGKWCWLFVIPIISGLIMLAVDKEWDNIINEIRTK